MTERNKHNQKYELNKLTYVYNCTRHSVTGFSPFYLMFGRNPRLPIDVLMGNNTDQNTSSTHIEKWKRRTKEAFGIEVANTKQRRDMDKRKKGKKAGLQPLEVSGRVLVRNLNERGGITYFHAKSFKTLKAPTCKVRYPVNQLEQEKLNKRNIKE